MWNQLALTSVMVLKLGENDESFWKAKELLMQDLQSGQLVIGLHYLCLFIKLLFWI